jgi:hypothetical protein
VGKTGQTILIILGVVILPLGLFFAFWEYRKASDAEKAAEAAKQQAIAEAAAARNGGGGGMSIGDIAGSIVGKVGGTVLNTALGLFGL